MKLLSSRFSPRLVDSDTLARLTVGRDAVLERIVGNLLATILAGQGRFDLLVGPRGVGKSHMFGRVEARLRAHPQLHERLALVVLPEEFHPSSLLHLLASVLEGLPNSPEMVPVAAQLKALRGRDASEALDMVTAMIRARLQGRALLVMLENLDAIFSDLGRKAQAQLRKIVQTEAGWSIFATACSSIALTKQSEPFHGTFVVEPLDMLSPTDCRAMMQRLAEVHEQDVLATWLESDAALVHVRAAHHLLGGSPRVIAMLFHHLDPNDPGDFEGNFFRLAEEVTPYFQEQMGRLSAGQRPVMEFLAKRWAPASVSEIADATFVPATTVSTHLRALRNNRLVRAMAVGKERYYEIADPLHRVARAMKEDRRLGAAIAHMARMWALMSARGGGGEALGRLVEYCEKDSEYVRALFEKLGKAGGDEESVPHIDVLMPHVQGHPRQSVVVLELMKLGRDAEALANIEVMVSANRTGALIVLFLVWRIVGNPTKCPASHTALVQCIARGGLIELDEVRARAALGELAVIAFAIPDMQQFESMIWQGLTHEYKIRIVMTAWLRGKFDLLCAEVGEDCRILLAMSSTEIGLLRTCVALDEAVRSARPIQPSEYLEACVPLWIATGRDLAPLRQILPTDVPYSFAHALTATDHAHAFSSLGAEVRVLVRQVLELLHLHDLLRALPSEPTQEPV